MFLRFPGQWEDGAWDEVDGERIVYNVFRWYQTDGGRYNRRDPTGLANPNDVAAGLGYIYADGRPVQSTDRLGLYTAFGNSVTRSRIRNAMNRIAKGLKSGRKKNKDCCTQYFSQLGQTLDTMIAPGGPPFIVFVPEGTLFSGSSPRTCGTAQTGPPFTYLFIRESCFEKPDPCKLASAILHEMGHLARKDNHDNEPPEFFKDCNLGCAKPGLFQ